MSSWPSFQFPTRIGLPGQAIQLLKGSSIHLSLKMSQSAPAWLSLMGSLVQYGGPDGHLLPEAEYSQHLQECIDLISRQDTIALIDVIRPLGAYLVTEDDVPRCRAISFLAELVDRNPSLGLRKPEDVHYLAEFFTSRLMDWPALHGALAGCYAVVKSDGLDSKDALAMLQTINDGVYVRSLSQKDRSLAMKVIDSLVKKCGILALEEDIDLIELVIVSIDGEKDPECLMGGFKAAQTALSVFMSLQDAGEYHVEQYQYMLENAKEELFDILACYFPVSFTPKDARGITREDIAKALQGTLLVWPGLHAAVLDLIEEKMSSIVKQAKLDSIQMLNALASQKDHSVLLKESRRVWNMIRPELMSASLDCRSYPQMFQSADDLGIGRHALKCLSKCLVACNAAGKENTLAQEALSDLAIEDAMKCIEYIGNDEESFTRSVSSVRSTAIIFQACSLAGGDAGYSCLTQFGPRILQVLEKPSSVESECFGTILLYSMILNAGYESPCNEEMLHDESIRGMLSMGMTFSHKIPCTNDSFLWNNDSFTWSTNRVDYNDSTLFLAKLKICHSLMVNPAFSNANLFQDDTVQATVQGCLEAISRLENDEFSSLVSDTLYQIVFSNLGSAFHGETLAIKTSLDMISKMKEDGSVRVHLHRILSFVAHICSGVSRQEQITDENYDCTSEVFDFLMENIRSSLVSSSYDMIWEELIQGIVMIEKAFDEKHETSNSEIALLNMLLGGSTWEEAPSVSEDIAEGILMSAFHICRRLPNDDLPPPFSLNSENETSDWISEYASIGCILGLCPNKLKLLDIHLMEQLFEALSRCSNPHQFKWYGIALASAVNKHVEDASASSNSPEELGIQMLNMAFKMNTAQWWDACTAYCGLLAMKGYDLRSILDEICTIMYDKPDVRSLAYKLLSTMFISTSDEFWVSGKAHAQVSFLWQQKAFITAKKCIEGNYIASEENAVVKRIACASLISGAPLAVIQSDSMFIAQQMCEFLGSKPCVDQILSSTSALENILKISRSLLESEKTRSIMIAQLSSIIPNLVTVTKEAYAGNARKSSLETLTLLANILPYQTIHPYRQTVLKASVSACDDRKRAVRFVAASCRDAWSQ